MDSSLLTGQSNMARCDSLKEAHENVAEDIMRSEMELL